jgi:hypothetical protein
MVLADQSKIDLFFFRFGGVIADSKFGVGLGDRDAGRNFEVDVFTKHSIVSSRQDYTRSGFFPLDCSDFDLTFDDVVDLDHYSIGKNVLLCLDDQFSFELAGDFRLGFESEVRLVYCALEMFLVLDIVDLEGLDIAAAMFGYG